MAKRFSTVVADPPWKGGNKMFRPNMKDTIWNYPQMKTEDIARLPVQSLVTRAAHLYLWFVNSMGEDAYKVARAWGFEPKTILTWRKPTMGIGYYFRNDTEHVLFCVGSAVRRTKTRNTKTCFDAERQGHSVKPPEFFDLVERNSYGPYLELFARRPREGWSVWGNEVKSDVRLK